jgi:hypothetical protein
MPCDAGRLRSILEWLLITGSDDNDKDFRDMRRLAKAGAADGNADSIFTAIRDRTEGRDDSSYHVAAECHRENKKILVDIARDLLGIKGK